MKILIKNCTLISMSENFNKIEDNIDILIKDNSIEKIEKDINEVVDKTIDATGKIVMPGLINLHCHVPMSIFRETLEGYNLQDWLSKKIWPMESRLTGDDIYNASVLSFLEMIRTGTTMVNDQYFMTEDIIRAMDKTGIRLETTRFLMNAGGLDIGEKAIIELDNLLSNYQSKNRLTFNVGVHSLYSSTSEYIDKCVNFAREKKLNIHMHFLENYSEITDITKIYQDKPINVLTSKFKDMKLILAHCTCLDNNDIIDLKNMNASIAHCPASNLKLGCGIAPIKEVIANGINVGLGTDGQGSGCNLDLFEAMKLTALLQKGKYNDPGAIDSYDILKMATINGAKALGLDNEIGSIEIGKKADLIIIDNNKLLTSPMNDLIANIVYNTNGRDVDTTIVDGNILMENNKLIFGDYHDIIKNCENIISRINS